jgi:hypothetical protein
MSQRKIKCTYLSVVLVLTIKTVDTHNGMMIQKQQGERKEIFMNDMLSSTLHCTHEGESLITTASLLWNFNLLTVQYPCAVDIVTRLQTGPHGV